jgi:hypothetical protein
MDYVIWQSVAGSSFCALNVLRGAPEPQQIRRGISRIKDFPDGAFFEMDKRFPKQVALADSLKNMDGLVVVSNSLKEFIAAQSPRDIEFLPIAIRDHQDKDTGAAYWILNPIAIVDCIDQSESTFEWNAIDPTMMSDCEVLVIDPKKIPADLLLLRPKHLEREVLVRKDLADQISAGKFTGLSFMKLSDYGG